MDLIGFYELVRGSHSCHPLQSIYYCISLSYSSGPLSFMLGQVWSMFFCIDFYYDLYFADCDPYFAVWASICYHWPKIVPILASVLFYVGSCYFWCKFWMPFRRMINDLCLVY